MQTVLLSAFLKRHNFNYHLLKIMLLHCYNYLCSVLVKVTSVFSCVPLPVTIYSFQRTDIDEKTAECAQHPLVQGKSTVVTSGLLDEHWVFSLPSEWLSTPPALSWELDNHRILSKTGNIKSLRNM